MAAGRLATLIQKLEKGLERSMEVFEGLTDEQWAQVVYPEGGWTMRDLLAHFIYSEEHLLEIAKDIASGGPGAPEDLDLDAFNQRQLERFEGVPPGQLLERMREARRATSLWARELSPDALDLVGRHPALGIVNLETILLTNYGHQLLHMRDVMPQSRSV